jgi:hypothetical protein
MHYVFEYIAHYGERRFLRAPDVFGWVLLQPTATVNNMLFGKPYLSHKGTIAVRNQETGLTVNLTFQPEPSLFKLGRKKPIKHEVSPVEMPRRRGRQYQG